MTNRSFIKWVGGKTRSLTQILPKFPTKFSTYYEPFLGSGVVYFNLRPYEAILNDRELNLVNAFRSVKRYPDEVIHCLSLLENAEDIYYDIRTDFNFKPEALPGEKAAQFIYINKCGYNGLYRVNKKGAVNVSYGKRSGAPHQDYEIIRKCSKALQKSRIMSADYKDILCMARKGDFVYLDPPYHKEFPDSFTGYTPNGFGEEDHKELAKECQKLTKRGVLFALSNSHTDFVVDLYKNMYTYPIYTNRTVSTDISGRMLVMELFITNYSSAGKIGQTR